MEGGARGSHWAMGYMLKGACVCVGGWGGGGGGSVVVGGGGVCMCVGSGGGGGVCGG